MAVKTGKPKNLPWYVEGYNDVRQDWVIRGFRSKKAAESLARDLNHNPEFSSVTFGWDVAKPKIDDYGTV